MSLPDQFSSEVLKTISTTMVEITNKASELSSMQNIDHINNTICEVVRMLGGLINQLETELLIGAQAVARSLMPGPAKTVWENSTLPLTKAIANLHRVGESGNSISLNLGNRPALKEAREKLKGVRYETGFMIGNARQMARSQACSPSHVELFKMIEAIAWLLVTLTREFGIHAAGVGDFAGSK